jgi:hypothetical protein
MSLHLTDEELYEVTGYRQREKQKQALAELRVPFRSRPADGFPLVVREHYVGRETTAGKPVKRAEPNFGASYG